MRLKKKKDNEMAPTFSTHQASGRQNGSKEGGGVWNLKIIILEECQVGTNEKYQWQRVHKVRLAWHIFTGRAAHHLDLYKDFNPESI